MKKLNKSQMKALEPYECYFETAVNHNYVRSIPVKDVRIMEKVHIELGLGSINIGCPKCVLNLCKTLGGLYSYIKSNNERIQTTEES